MKTLRWGAVIAGAALGISIAGDAVASYPAGVWVRVDKVVLEPDATNPTSIQIHGAAILYDGSADGPYAGYTKPAKGYLYYQCPAGKEATCKLEWADVEANIGKPPEVCVGLGDQSLPTGTLRPSNQAPAGSDTYPIAMGVLSGFTPCQVLADFVAGGTSSSSSSAASSGAPTSSGSTSAASSGAGGSGGGSNNGTGTPGQDGGCSVGDMRGAGIGGLALCAMGLSAAMLRRRRR